MEPKDKVEDAIMFLLHPDVMNMPSSSKQQFLQEKGLTPEEIHIAFAEAAIRSQKAASVWETTANNTATAVILGGACYLGYLGFRRFLRWINGSVEYEKEVAERERILTTLEDIRGRIQSLDQRLDPLETRLRHLEGSQSAEKLNLQREQQDLRAQLNSVRSLMLSSKSFSPIPPQSSLFTATPAASSGSSSVRLPAWQLGTTNSLVDVNGVKQNGNNFSKLDENADSSSKSLGRDPLEEEPSTNDNVSVDGNAPSVDDTQQLSDSRLM